MAEPNEREQAPRRPVSRLRGVSLGRIFGIQIVADWSLIIIFLLVMVNLGLGVFPEWHPDWSGALVWGMAFAAAVLFFASVLAHELSHSLVGRIFGIPVRRITLFIFGGMAETEKEPPSPKAELLMAAAGPLLSIALGVAATAAGAALGRMSIAQTDQPIVIIRNLGPGATLLLWLGPINVLLGLFNLVPGFPLDGGRVLRAFLWWITHDLTKATRWSSYSGQAFAGILMALGLTSLLSGGVGQGIWLLLIGWFLFSAARAGYQQTLIQQALSHAHVHDVMRRRLESVPPDLSVADFIGDHLMQTDQQCFPVVTREGHLEGLVCIEDVRRVPRDDWMTTTVTQVMTPIDDLNPMHEDQPATDALRALGERNVDQVPVVDDEGSLLGLVRRQDILRWLSLHQRQASAHS